MTAATAYVAVLGGGAAGLSAALWCASLGLRVEVFEERAHSGGQLHEIPLPIENVPGLLRVSGAALHETLLAQVGALGVPVHVGVRASLRARTLTVETSDGRVIDPDVVVLATGVRRRALGVEGEPRWYGRGLLHNAGSDPSGFAGQRVVIVGGGDDALEHARMLAPHAASVMLVHRGRAYTARDAMRAPVLADPRIARRMGAVVTAMEGDDRLRAVRIREGDREELVALDVLLVCVGPEPASGIPGVSTDARGYVRVDRLQRTSRDGVLAVGDVCSPEAPTLATAMGQGAIAAKTVVAGLVRWPHDGPRVDRLRVQNLALPARIGAYEYERAITQTLVFDLTFELDAGDAAPTDSLLRTIDYASVARHIEGLLGEQHFNLVETVADVAATQLLSHFGARAVTVRVTKPGVPREGASASVEVERRRG